MSITVRPDEKTLPLSLTKDGWLAVLALVSELLDSAANDQQETVLKDLWAIARGFVLSKEKTSEFTTQLNREQVLDLYLFMSEFPEQIQREAVLESMKSSFKAFLVGVGE